MWLWYIFAVFDRDRQPSRRGRGRLVGFLRGLFLAGVLIGAALLSCLTAMRLAIRGSEVTVPGVVGRSLEEATRRISGAQLVLKVRGQRFDDHVPPDGIIAQSPADGGRLKSHGTVKVLVSLGPRRIQVPDLRGKTLRAGRYQLLQRGLTPGFTATISSDSTEKDLVLSQFPLPGEQESQSPTVNMLISSGRSRVAYLMPDLVGKRLGEVSRTLALWDIQLGEVRYQSLPGLAPGTVLEHSPAAGDIILEAALVDFEVAR